MVLVSRKDKLKIYTYLLQEGVLCFKKDYNAKDENLQILNLHIFLVIRSLLSRKFVTEIFSWQWHYFFLTESGVKFLREYLGLPKEVIPNTYKFENPVGEEEPQQEEKEDKEENRERGRGRKRGGRTAEQPTEGQQ